MKRITALSILIVFITIGCSKYKECASILPIEPHADFQIVDANGINLVGDGLRYEFEDIRLFNSTQDVPLEIRYSEEEDITVLSFYFGQMISFEAYNLELNDTETDILTFEFYIEESLCFDLKLIQNVSVNTMPQELGGSAYYRSFVIIK